MTSTVTLSLIKALSLSENASHVDAEVAQVATDWFTHWLEARAHLELSDGRQESADALMRASYALKHSE